MTTAASTIIARVQTQLIDEDATRWSEIELLRWLSDGQRLVATLVPGSTATVTTMSTANGARQAIPPDGIRLIAVVRNVGGGSVTQIDRTALNAQRPNWPSDPATRAAKFYSMDPADLRTFYLYPPAKGQQIEVVYAVVPPEVTSITQNISVPDQYAPALVDYILYRAHMKDDDGVQNGSAQGYYTTFTQFLSAMAGTPAGAE